MLVGRGGGVGETQRDLGITNVSQGTGESGDRTSGDLDAPFRHGRGLLGRLQKHHAVPAVPSDADDVAVVKRRGVGRLKYFALVLETAPARVRAQEHRTVAMSDEELFEGRIVRRRQLSNGHILRRMKKLIVLALAASVASAIVAAQSTSQKHIDAARAAAGADFAGVFNRICTEAVPKTPPEPRPARGANPRPPGPPVRDTWHAEPVQVFDNLYFLGQTEYSVWAIKTSDGLILIDAIFDYSVDDEVAGGLRKLGLDPAQIKYVIISHGHGDHSGGAKYLQDKFNAHVLLTAADWDLLDRSNGSKPRRDMVVTDGQKLTLGDTTVTMYNTAGHTLGTLSTIFPVTDHGTPHVVATWGGTAFNWMANSAPYYTPERPESFWFKTYSDSARRFKEIAAKAGADVLISNHTIFDGSKTKLPLVLARKPGDPNPYVIGKEAVQRYLTVVDECAQAGLTRNQ